MAETAAHLVDHVFPPLPVRHCCILDGVFEPGDDRAIRFLPAVASTPQEIAAIDEQMRRRAGLERLLHYSAPLFRLGCSDKILRRVALYLRRDVTCPNESGAASGRRDQGGGILARSDLPGSNVRFAKSCCPDPRRGQCRFLAGCTHLASRQKAAIGTNHVGWASHIRLMSFLSSGEIRGRPALFD